MAYPPMHVQANGLLLEALKPILNRHGFESNDPRIAFLNPKADGKWLRRGKTTLLVIMCAFVVLILIGGIWAFWATGTP